MENMPVVKNLYGKADIFTNSIVFNINGGRDFAWSKHEKHKENI